MLRHQFNSGVTRHGKTWSALETGRKFDGPVLFFNPQQEDAPGYIEANSSTPLARVRQALENKRKVNFVPSGDKKRALAELDFLVRRVLSGLPNNVLLIADEADDYAKQGWSDSPLFWVAQRGLKHGMAAIFISQSPSEVDKIVLKNCEVQKVFFFNEYGAKYYKDYGYNVEDMARRIEANGKYSYILLDNGKDMGVFKD